MNKALTTAIASLTLENRSGQGFVTALISPKCCCYGISALSCNRGEKELYTLLSTLTSQRFLLFYFLPIYDCKLMK